MDEIHEIVLDISTFANDFSYHTPGQYCQIIEGEPDQFPGFYAIASAPPSSLDESEKSSVSSSSRNHLEFLVKRTSTNANLCNVGIGDSVNMTSALGEGFQVSRAFFSKGNFFFSFNIFHAINKH